MAPPLVIGLTGGIGAGKSEALAACERHGAKTISTDEVSHEVIGSPEVRDLLVERWGEDVASKDGVDRAAIARIVFERPEELAYLESQLHPRVGERVAAWRGGLGEGELGVVEVPLLFESGMEPFFDATVCITADSEVRERRAADRGHEGLEGRSSRQLAQEEKAERATHVIENDGSLEELDRKVSALIDEIAR